MNSVTYNPYSWEIGNTKTGYVVTKGDERYTFQTMTAAKYMRDILLKHYTYHSMLTTTGNSLSGFRHSPSTFVLRPQGREVLRVSQDGVIEKFDLPYFVSCWLKTTTLYRFYKTLMHGENWRLK